MSGVERLFAESTCVVRGDMFTAPVDAHSMRNPQSGYYERPMGFYSEDLRQKFIDSSVRIAGVGGGGATLAVMLAKEGVRDFSIADIEKIDATNVGRIPVFTPDNIGQYKVDVVAELIVKHNPTAEVRIYGDGIQRHNVDDFIGYDAGNSGIAVGFDEIELTEPMIALLFHRAARRFGRYVIAATDVGRGGMVTTFDPASRHTFEDYMGSSPVHSEEKYLKKVKGFQLPTIPNIPKNGSISTLVSTQTGASLPTTLRSVLNATDLAMDEFEKILTIGDARYDQPHIYPRLHCVDPSHGEDFTTRFPRVRSISRIVQLAMRDVLGMNPPTSYSKDDIARRAAARSADLR